LEESKPYLYHGHDPSMDTITNLLRVFKKDLREKKLSRNGVVGSQQSYLLERMNVLSEEKD